MVTYLAKFDLFKCYCGPKQTFTLVITFGNVKCLNNLVLHRDIYARKYLQPHCAL